MNSKERVLRAIYFEEPDRVPWFELGYDPRILMQIFKEGASEKYSSIMTNLLNRAKGVQDPEYLNYLLGAVKILGIDTYVSTPTDPTYFKILNKEHFVDECGRLFTTKLIGDVSAAYMGPYVDTPEKFDSFNWPPSITDFKIKTIRTAKKVADENGIFLVAGCGSVMELGMEAIGIPQFCRSLYTNPDFVQKVIRRFAEWTLGFGKALADEGAEGLLIFDDYSYHSGPIISPAHWMKYIYPWNKRVLEGLHKKGVPVILHACGDVRPLMEGIIDSGYDAIHPLEPTANITLKEAKEKWGDRICLIGNISINTLYIGSEEDVEREVKDAISTAAPSSGYLISSAHALYEQKPQNVISMSKTIRKYGKNTKHIFFA